MTDFINREEALNAIVSATIYDNADAIEIMCDASVCDSEGWLGGIRDALRAIENVPSAEPERKWIPVTEALPEEREWLGTKQFGTTISDVVYVTFENPKGERFCKHLSFQNGKLSKFDQSTINAFYPDAKPIAWMPLPEPYRGE